MNRLFIRIDIRSSLSFIVFAIIAVSTTIFLLVKADQAINEIQKLSNTQVSLGAEKMEIGSEIDVSNWKTYRNEQYGFEVKYPQNWNISSPAAVRKSTIFATKFQSSKVASEWIELAVEPNFNKELPTPEWFQEWSQLDKSNKPQGFDAKDFIFQGLPVLKINLNMMFFAYDGHMLRVTWSHPEVYSTIDKLSGHPIIDKILSTLKFIK